MTKNFIINLLRFGQMDYSDLLFAIRFHYEHYPTNMFNELLQHMIDRDIIECINPDSSDMPIYQLKENNNDYI